MTLIKGRHLLHFGAGAIIFRADSTAWGNLVGASLGFTGVYTAGSNTGPLASNSGFPMPTSSWVTPRIGAPEFAGIRRPPEESGRLRSGRLQGHAETHPQPRPAWEGNTGWSDVNSNVRSFDPNVINPATGKPGAMWYGTTTGQRQNSAPEAGVEQLAAAIGFAYLLGTKTTIRGGFGMYTFPWNVDSYGGGLGQRPSVRATRPIPPATCRPW